MRLWDAHGAYLERLARVLVQRRSVHGVVAVCLARQARRHGGEWQPAAGEDRRDLTRLLVRLCTDLEMVQPGSVHAHPLPRAMSWLGEVVVLRRVVRALHESEHLGEAEVADLLGISPASVLTLLGVSGSPSVVRTP